MAAAASDALRDADRRLIEALGESIPQLMRHAEAPNFTSGWDRDGFRTGMAERRSSR